MYSFEITFTFYSNFVRLTAFKTVYNCILICLNTLINSHDSNAIMHINVKATNLFLFILSTKLEMVFFFLVQPILFGHHSQCLFF